MWPRVVCFLLLGYLSMSRSFAYLGIPQWNVFVGEICLGAFLFTRPRAILSRWATALPGRSPLTEFAWALYLFLSYGLIQVWRGLSQGYPVLTTLRDFAFNYYPLYLFLGLYVGLRQPKFLHRFIRVLAWWNGLYGLTYVLLLYFLPYTMPGTESVRLFGQPIGSAVAILGLLCFERNLAKVRFLLLLNAFVMLGVAIRAEWLGFTVGLLLLGWLSGRLRVVVAGVAAVVLLLTIGYLTDFSLPGPGGGGEISSREIVARVVAPFNPNLAAELTPFAEGYAGTVQWRVDWWTAIWSSIHEDLRLSLLGHGYGYPLADLVVSRSGEALRTPHNIFFYALGYGGWISIALFFLLQVSLARLLLRAYRITGQPFGLVFWAVSLAIAFFGGFYETPFGAIPSYLLIGLAIAPVLLGRRETNAHPMDVTH